MSLDKAFNEEKERILKNRKLCDICGNKVYSAVAGHCRDCWEDGLVTLEEDYKTLSKYKVDKNKK